MDRWEDADDDTLVRDDRLKHLGRVAREGLSGFNRSDASLGGPAATTIGPTFTIVASKREQRQQAAAAEATRLMPPPPAFMQGPPSAVGAPPKWPPPAWATRPPPGAILQAWKDGVEVQQIPLERLATVFGRNDVLADVVLDHPSISRQHAAICFEAGTGRCLVIDLGSAHGTFLEGKQLQKDTPNELKPGHKLRFAASSRTYTLTLPPVPTGATRSSEEINRPAKKARVTFGGGDEGALEQVIGYSDGKDFVARVGPQKATAESGGMFADAVTSTVFKAGAAGGSGLRRGGSPPPPGGLKDPFKKGPLDDDADDDGQDLDSTTGTTTAGTDERPRQHAGSFAEAPGGLAAHGQAGASDTGTSRGAGDSQSSGGGHGSGGNGVKPQLAAVMQQLRNPPAKVSLYGDMPPPSMPPPSQKRT